MRRFVVTVFDEWVYETPSVSYVADSYQDLLGSVDELAVQIITDRCNAKLLLTVFVQSSTDGTHWTSHSNLVTDEKVSASTTNVHVGVTDVTLKQRRVRLGVQLVNALGDAQARVRLIACGRSRSRSNKDLFGPPTVQRARLWHPTTNQDMPSMKDATPSCGATCASPCRDGGFGSEQRLGAEDEHSCACSSDSSRQSERDVDTSEDTCSCSSDAALDQAGTGRADADFDPLIGTPPPPTLLPTAADGFAVSRHPHAFSSAPCDRLAHDHFQVAPRHIQRASARAPGVGGMPRRALDRGTSSAQGMTLPDFDRQVGTPRSMAVLTTPASALEHSTVLAEQLQHFAPQMLRSGRDPIRRAATRALSSGASANGFTAEQRRGSSRGGFAPGEHAPPVGSAMPQTTGPQLYPMGGSVSPWGQVGDAPALGDAPPLGFTTVKTGFAEAGAAPSVGAAPPLEFTTVKHGFAEAGDAPGLGEAPPLQFDMGSSRGAEPKGSNFALDEIEFFERAAVGSIGALGPLIVRKIATAPDSHAWGESELNALPSTPTEDVIVRFTPSSDRTELNLFAFDPREAKQFFEGLTWALPSAWPDPTCPNGNLDDFPPEFVAAYSECGCATSDFIIYDVLSGEGVRPDAAAIPGMVFVLPEITVSLSPNHFWSDGIGQGLASLPSGTGSIKAVRLMNHGACSRAFSLQDLVLEPAANDLWARALDDLTAFEFLIDSIERHFIHATSYLDYTPGDALSPRGGFFIDFSIEVFSGLVWPSSIQVCGTVEYEFVLEDGLLRVVPTVHSIGAQNVDWFGTNIAFEVFKAATETAPAIFADIVDARQIRDDFAFPCEADPILDCGNASAILAEFIDNGDFGYDLSDGEINQLKDTLSEPDENSNTGLRHWRCIAGDPFVPEGVDPSLIPGILPEGPRTCRFVLRAKRLNVYPDEIELVWFDGPEVFNAAFAAYLALRGREMSTRALCSGGITDTEVASDGHFKRSFPEHVLPFTEVDF